MLTHLHIINFAIIDEIGVDFYNGETVLTGETGAGKSILLDALGLVLGDRADADVVRESKQQADITAVFDIEHVPEARQWLEAQSLSHNNECMLRRAISHEGRSKAFINGQPATLASMRELGEMLVSIHGQHEHQALLKRDVQRRRLDDYAGHHTLLNDLKQQFHIWKTVHEQLKILQMAEQNRNERLDLLRFQVQEFANLKLAQNEYETLSEQHKRMANASELLSVSHTALDRLYDDDERALYHQLSHTHNSLQQLLKADPALTAAVEMLNTGLIQIQETTDFLRNYVETLEINPADLQNIEDRLSTLHDLARKHRVHPEALHTLAETLSHELHQLENMDQQLQTLAAQEQHSAHQYKNTAEQLHKSRQQAAHRLAAAVSETMQGLAMQGGRFDIQIDLRQDATFSATGLDEIEFLVSANPGQTPKSLAKVASGGELSRISLAIQMITASSETVPTLIFDEVDAGIGGGTAEIIGRHLRTLGEQRQVMCVTHLPQVAAQAHHHLKVSKHARYDNGTSTVTHSLIEKLDQPLRIQEIARMLGGLNITENTLKHAEEMLHQTAT